MNIIHCKEAITFLTAEEEIIVFVLSRVDGVHLTCDVFETCQHVFAVSTVFTGDALHDICGDKTLDDKRLPVPASLFPCCCDKVIGKERCDLVSGKEKIIILFMSLRDGNAESVCIRISAENYICLDFLRKFNDLCHGFSRLGIRKFHSRERTVRQFLLAYDSGSYAKSLQHLTHRNVARTVKRCIGNRDRGSLDYLRTAERREHHAVICLIHG